MHSGWPDSLVSDLKPGLKVLVKLEEGGRHFGSSVYKETITESSDEGLCINKSIPQWMMLCALVNER